MGKKSDQKGICRICSKEDKLSFEHIPPEKAFNETPLKAIIGEELFKTITETKRKPWDTSKLKYEPKQKGMGIYSLCEKCNNNTGHWYAQEYIKFANTIDWFYNKYDIKTNENFNFVVNEIIPLNFVKQVITMFCSIVESLVKCHPIFAELILDKYKKGIDIDKYRLGMFLIKDKRIAYNGITIIGMSNGKRRCVASIDAYPLGFTLDINPIKDFEYNERDITHFLNDYEYNEKVNLEFSVPVLERNIIFPADYRKKEEIETGGNHE